MKRMTFKELGIDELYAICKLRQDVFVVEQNSIYTDLDDLDQLAMHYLDLNKNGELLGYARYREVGNGDFKLERVVLRKDARGTGRGKALIESILADIKGISPIANVTLSAQTNAVKLYRLFGFQEQGEPYDDGGIEHITMTLQLN
ncbi:GNAT family N-acetyltransferase [Paraglaciecola sp. 2405UD69-4]|uniref:GNAT family N-acetyltransferase n=1 Tax=Paraglaciecola sp. 2405UD69-4 TaxID=3391836 RepID=UPI0039C901B0